MPIRLTRAQVREIDRRATADYGIPGIVLMENAARSAADVAMEMLAGIKEPSVKILCGGGNNGGDGLAIARHLHNRGVTLQIVAAWNAEPKGDAGINLRIVQSMNLPLHARIDLHLPSMLIDALFGTGLARPSTGPLAQLVDSVNQSGQPILAIDVPSGLDCDTGEPLGPCIHATRTITFVAEKAGFANPRSRDFTGEVSIGDIGIPPELIAAVMSP